MNKIKFFALTLAFAALAHAQPRLPFIDSLLINFPVEQCCATTLEKCAKEKPGCPAAPRLAAFTKWMDNARQQDGTKKYSNEQIIEMLKDRDEMYATKRKYNVDHTGWPVDGDPKAPVTISVYFMGTCPMCKTNYAILYREVTAGRLKGKAKMISKPLVAGTPNLILMAAYQMGKFSEFMLALAARGGRVDEDMLNAIADELKLDKTTLKKISEDPALKKRIELVETEANKNGVTHTPYYFINGRKYNSVLDAQWVIDAIDFELETMKK
jgi:protein-disulfide isomerase